jgi:hypothetical protein
VRWSKLLSLRERYLVRGGVREAWPGIWEIDLALAELQLDLGGHTCRGHAGVGDCTRAFDEQLDVSAPLLIVEPGAEQDHARVRAEGARPRI